MELKLSYSGSFPMKCLLKTILISVVVGVATARASSLDNLDTIGVTLLRATTTNLNGAGVRVGQAEGDDAGTPPGVNTWEVRPNSIGQPTNLFTWIKGSSPYLLPPGTANTYTNSLGLESGHAEFVADNFYGITNGVATNVAHVDNYEANTFIEYYVGFSGVAHAIPERVVNQSFTFGVYDTNVDQTFDNYAAQNNVLFISGAGFDGQPVYSPATCYNGIGVGSTAFNSP